MCCQERPRRRPGAPGAGFAPGSLVVPLLAPMRPHLHATSGEKGIGVLRVMRTANHVIEANRVGTGRNSEPLSATLPGAGGLLEQPL
jgi:hypothetical protein